VDDFSQFHPLFQMALREIFRDLRALGWQPRVASGLRTPQQQADKVRKGYSKTMRSWHVTSTIGILPVGRDKYDVVRGQAADIVDARYGWDGPAKHRDFAFWKDLGRAAKDNGCDWGGDWKAFPDMAHVQLLFVEEAPHKTALA